MKRKPRNHRKAEPYTLRGIITKTFFSTLFILISLFMSAGSIWGELANNKMDYHDYHEMVPVLQNLCDDHPDIVTLKSIGHSLDIPVALSGPTHYYNIYALRVGPVGDLDFADIGDVIPSILFVGGIHGREWLASESLIELAQYLTEKAQDAGTLEYALLKRVAVWIIPMANPSGRMIDDLNAGDPEDFYQGSGNTTYGWRHSGDTRGCESAVDIARNFSTGWGTASDAGCAGGGWYTHFQGLAPTSNHETAALREFVQNHWICMAVDVHSSSQRIWNTWGTGDKAGVKMKQRAVERWERGLMTLGERIYERPDPESPLHDWISWYVTMWDFVDRFTLDDNYATGTGGGQFTAWLQEEQHIQSFLVELPPYNPRPRTDYVSSEFQYDPDDASNTFHPSSSRARQLIKDSFIPMANYLIGQADAPGSATSIGIVLHNDSAHAFDTSESNGSPSRDFGILAAKIGINDPGAVGQIVSQPAFLEYTPQPDPGYWYFSVPAFDWLYPHYSYELYYWVQNYSQSNWTRCNVRLELKSRPHGSTDAWTVDTSDSRRYRLSQREKVFDRFPFRLEEGRDYELTVRGVGRFRDRFSNNDKKIFKFTTYWGL